MVDSIDAALKNAGYGMEEIGKNPVGNAQHSHSP